MEKKFRSIGLLICFLGVIYFPLLNEYTGAVEDIKSFENRQAHKKPILALHTADSFPHQYDNYYNDTFQLRNRFIKYYNYYNVTFYRQSPLNTVIIGKDNWLFFSGEELDSYTGRNRFTDEELQTIREELEFRSQYLARLGVKFYFMIVPAKICIYSDKVGYEYYRMNKQTWGEQVNDYLKKTSGIKIIDIFDSLRSHSEPVNLYYRLDNHWNELGGFYAARQVLLNMKKDLPALEVPDVNDVAYTSSITIKGNLNKMLGYLDVFREQEISLTPKKGYKAVQGEFGNYPPTPGFAYPWEYEKVKEIKNSSKPRLLIISDSFGEAIFPFLAESFSRTCKIWDSWQYKLNEDIVQGEKPDVYLLMIDEPILHNLLDPKMSSRNKPSGLSTITAGSTKSE